jgi:nucleoside-diphosphate-sugar epimerase
MPPVHRLGQTSMTAFSQPGQPTALILGITGAIGGAIATALASRGYAIRALTRGGSRKLPLAYPVEWLDGDVADRDRVIVAAQGAALIVHAVNPPGYTKWRQIAMPQLANTIAAAQATGATILFPANVYVYNPVSGALVDETTPMAPKTRKGQVRLEMETMLADAAARHGVRTIAVRAGDFFGPGVTNSWFSQAIAKGGRAAKVLHDLSDPGVGHAWAYVPDLAETFARLADRRDSLAPYEMVHFNGHWTDPGRAMAEATQRVIGRADLPIKPFSRLSIYLGAPFVRFLLEVIEMLWLWRHPLRLNNAKLERLIGPEPHTPLADAIAATLDAPSQT